jgi:hypothetical protein
MDYLQGVHHAEIFDLSQVMDAFQRRDRARLARLLKCGVIES